MLGGVGHQSAYGTNSINSKAVTPGPGDQTAALNGQVRHDQIQLNDWLTCVSAKTPKGKAEIESLSARISSAKQHIAKDQAATWSVSQPDDSSPTSKVVLKPSASRGVTAYGANSAADRRSMLLNTWA
ncbi:MAG TPA: hypothetical protein VI653_18660 [Steroidobacteraceae bacterium]